MKNGPYELVIAPVEYPGRLYRERYCYEHQLVWWQNTGQVVPKGKLIHHKDGNKRNNKFDNLEMKDRKIHSSEHGKSRGVTLVEFRCPGCLGVFSKEKRHSHLVKSSKYTFCSRVCIGKVFYKGSESIPKDFINIIKEYKEYPVV